MAQYGATPAALRRAIETSLNGAEVSQVYEEGIPYDVTVILNPQSRSSLESIANLPVDSKDGKIALSAVADVVSSTGPNTINRENVKRRIVISANMGL